MLNYYLILGDRVWLQGTGIPMGFSCSLVWCNMYLLSYKIKFIQCQAKLGQVNLLAKFNHALYINDLCFFNIQNPCHFLSPNQLGTDDNPFWIYCLNVLEIKEEVTAFSHNISEKEISAHFMNVEFILNELDPQQFIYQKYDK